MTLAPPTCPADLVPELSVRDLAASLAFWCGPCGFAVVFDRPEQGFACVQRGTARVMLDQLGTGRDWVTAPLELPLGRGINLEIAVRISRQSWRRWRRRAGRFSSAPRRRPTASARGQ